MAVLRSSTGEVELILRPYRVSEEGQPTWILTQLVLDQGAKLLSTTLSLTKEDLSELGADLRGISTGAREGFAMTGLDADFIFEVQTTDSPGDLSVSFWYGEPYELMKGYRFIATASAILDLADELESDERNLAPPARLP